MAKLERSPEGTTTTTTMGQNISLLRRLQAPVSEDCVHKAFRAYWTPNVTFIDLLSGNEGAAGCGKS